MSTNLDNREIFKQNKYHKWYKALILKRLESPASVQGEKHHYIPTSILKNDDVVLLSFREHYIAHLLLVRCVNTSLISKMWYAVTAMKLTVLKNTKFNSRLFESLKIKANMSRKQLRGMKRSTETCEKIRIARTGTKGSDQFKEKCRIRMTGEKNPMYGKTHTPESITKIVEGRRSFAGENNPMFGSSRTGEASPNHGRVWINDGVSKKMIKRGDSLPDGWLYGYGIRQKPA